MAEVKLPEKVLVNYREPHPDALIKVSIAVLALCFKEAGQVYIPRASNGAWRGGRVVIETDDGNGYYLLPPNLHTSSLPSQSIALLDIDRSVSAGEPIIRHVGVEVPPITVGTNWSPVTSGEIIAKILVVDPELIKVLPPHVEPKEEYDISDRLMRQRIEDAFGSTPESLVASARREVAIAYQEPGV